MRVLVRRKLMVKIKIHLVLVLSGSNELYFFQCSSSLCCFHVCGGAGAIVAGVATS